MSINTETTGHVVLDITITAGNSVVGYTFGNLDGSSTAAEAKPHGIFATTKAEGEPVKLVMAGSYRIRTGGVFDVGDNLEVDANSMAVKVANGAIAAVALEQAYGVANETALVHVGEL